VPVDALEDKSRRERLQSIMKETEALREEFATIRKEIDDLRR